ncbi:MAG: acyltransferase [bacterium]|nr:acyltransferase [bacterium]
MGKRKLESIKTPGKNSLRHVWKYRDPLRVFFNFLIIYCAKYVPSMELKKDLLKLTGMKVGKNASIGLAAMFDIFYPELIEIGENSIIGYNTTIIAHEYLINELRTGKVIIGKDVMIGANSTILAGVSIGDHATVSAATLVDRDVPSNNFAKGNPMGIGEKK